MSLLFTLEESKLAEQLPAIFEKYEQEVTNAEPLFELKGQRLEQLARDLPHHQFHYAKLAADMKQVMKWLENYKAKLESRLTKNINSGNRAVGTREAGIYIAGEREMIELNQLIIEASLIWQHLEEIVEAWKQAGWMIGNITKLRVAELQDVIL